MTYSFTTPQQLLLSIIALILIASQSVKSDGDESSRVCPFRLVSYESSFASDCNENENNKVNDNVILQVVTSGDDLSSTILGSYDTDDCQFVSNGLFKVLCDMESNEVVLEPCVVVDYLQTSSFLLNTCYSSDIGNSFMVDGNCALVPSSSCELAMAPMPTVMPAPLPTPSPTAEIAADEVVLSPVVPLPSIPFADQFLSAETGREAVFLSTLAYTITSDENAIELLPDIYNFHLFRDTGSTEVFVASTNHTDEREGKIFVVFRGTDDTIDGDWIVDAQAR